MVEINRELFDTPIKNKNKFETQPGINESVVRQISSSKNEPEWMLNLRLKALTLFEKNPIPGWGPDLSKLDLNKIKYYVDPDAYESKSWDDVPAEIRETFEKLGIPEAEREMLAGVGAQFDSGMVYHNLEKKLSDLGVIFENMDVAVTKYPELVKKYFMTKCIPITDHKFINLHGAVWSGGTFIYVPKGVHVDLPLQAYFRMNAFAGGQFEHTLIIVDEGASLHYIEGCSSPRYNQDSLHAGCVEIYVEKNAKMTYSSIENWSKNVYNLNTKRAIVKENATMRWLNGNMGSCRTMLYPCSVLIGEGAYTQSLGIAFASEGQIQDTGTKVIHAAANTVSDIQSKSISKKSGQCTYRGLVKILKNAKNSKSVVNCDGMNLNDKSCNLTLPYIKSENSSSKISHEATVSKINDDTIFYLMSRGLSELAAMQLVVGGFIAPIIRELPLEYAVELNKLIKMEVEGL